MKNFLLENRKLNTSAQQNGKFIGSHDLEIQGCCRLQTPDYEPQWKKRDSDYSGRKMLGRILFRHALPDWQRKIALLDVTFYFLQKSLSNEWCYFYFVFCFSLPSPPFLWSGYRSLNILKCVVFPTSILFIRAPLISHTHLWTIHYDQRDEHVDWSVSLGHMTTLELGGGWHHYSQVHQEDMNWGGCWVDNQHMSTTPIPVLYLFCWEM